MEPLRGIKACVFDALGTLINEDKPLETARDELVADGVDAAKLQQVVDIWPDKTLEYLWLRSIMGALNAAGNVGENALDYAMSVARLTNCEVRERLLKSHEDREFYGDVAPVLRELREKGYTTAILSGSSREALCGLIESENLEDAFDAVFSVSAVDAVKPNPRTYQIAVDELGIAKREICFVSGNPWDAAGAAYFGFDVVPIQRGPRYLPENLPAHPHRLARICKPIHSMSKLLCRLSACSHDPEDPSCARLESI